MIEVLTATEAAGRVSRGDTVMVGGFGQVGAPSSLIAALVESPAATNLTVISNNVGDPGRGLGNLLLKGSIRRAIGSYFTSNPDAVRAYEAGDLEVELLPQGTLAEAIRAGGAGIGAFYVPTGVGTDLAAGREVREIAGQPHLLQYALRADVALIRAWRADAAGNLVFRRTARNFNPDMATAAELVIAEVDEVFPVGGLDPEAIVTPHVYVDALVESEGPAA